MCELTLPCCLPAHAPREQSGQRQITLGHTHLAAHEPLPTDESLLMPNGDVPCAQVQVFVQFVETRYVGLVAVSRGLSGKDGPASLSRLHYMD